MAKEDVAKKVLYSETIDLHETIVPGNDPKVLNSALKKMEDENRVLASNVRRLEEETGMLRELFNNVNNELNNLKKPALLVADVVSLLDNNKSVIKLPNGNKFLVYVGKDVKGVKAGDAVLVDQKSLNVVDRIDSNSNYEVE